MSIRTLDFYNSEGQLKPLSNLMDELIEKKLPSSKPDLKPLSPKKDIIFEPQKIEFKTQKPKRKPRKFKPLQPLRPTKIDPSLPLPPPVLPPPPPLHPIQKIVDENTYEINPPQPEEEPFELVDDIETNPIQKPTYDKDIVFHGGPKIKDPFCKNSNCSDNVYFNVNIRAISDIAATKVIYQISKEQSIVPKASDYYLTVVKCSIPCYYIPIAHFIYDDAFGHSIYSVKIKTTDGLQDSGLVYLEYYPRGKDMNYSFNPRPNTDSQTGSLIYYLFDFNVMIFSLNDALEAAYVLAGGNSDDAPFVVYDPATNICTVNTLETFVRNVNIGAVKYEIYFNEFLYELFNTLPADRGYEGIIPLNNGEDYLLEILYNKTNAYYPDPIQQAANKLWYKIPQDIPSVFQWSPVQRFLLNTTLIPTRPEYVNNENYNTDFQLTLLDFVPENNLNTRNSFEFKPSGQYNLTDITSDLDVREIDILFMWQDKWNNLNPIYLAPGTNTSLKLAFLNKELYNQTHLNGYMKI